MDLSTNYFMEGVFRKIEFWIEGDRNKQIRLASQPWNAEKIWKKRIEMVCICSHFSYHYALDVHVHRRCRRHA